MTKGAGGTLIQGAPAGDRMTGNSAPGCREDGATASAGLVIDAGIRQQGGRVGPQSRWRAAEARTLSISVISASISSVDRSPNSASIQPS